MGTPNGKGPRSHNLGIVREAGFVEARISELPLILL
jgi:hypothetical protein